MNAIEENEFSQGWQDIRKKIPKPNAVLCISAHWETNGTQVTAMETPRTIHNFGGFPRQLYNIEYPAPGNPKLAREIKKLITKTDISLDTTWGLDHGCWVVLKHLFPQADIPVIQLSLDTGMPALFHYELARELAALRTKGVLIVGSGNMVHNLGMIAWDKMDEPTYGYDWAQRTNDLLKKLILGNNHAELINYQSLGREMALSAPTPEHFLPLLYTLALQKENETVSIFNDAVVMGSISMTSFMVGNA